MTSHALPRAGGLLRAALKLDALVTGANAVAYLALAGPLADLLGVPSGALRAIGAFLAVFAIGVWAVAARAEISRSAAATVAVANLAWAAGSVVALIADAWSPETVGAVWIALQAAVVALFGDLQLLGLRRATRGAAAPAAS
jgi:hypothetical protein